MHASRLYDAAFPVRTTKFVPQEDVAGVLEVLHIPSVSGFHELSFNLTHRIMVCFCFTSVAYLLKSYFNHFRRTLLVQISAFHFLPSSNLSRGVILVMSLLSRHFVFHPNRLGQPTRLYKINSKLLNVARSYTYPIS